MHFGIFKPNFFSWHDLITPPAVVDREDFLLEDMLRHDVVEHWSDAIDGHVGVTHPQDSIKLGENEGHGWQRGGFSKNLHNRDTTDLQGKKKQKDGHRVGSVLQKIYLFHKCWTHHHHILT